MLNLMDANRPENGIRAIIKNPGEAPYEAWIENELKTLQEMVGGYIEAYTLCNTPAVIVICNEEGKLEGMPYNCRLAGETFVGPIVLVGVRGEEFADCPVSLAAAQSAWTGLRSTKSYKK